MRCVCMTSLAVVLLAGCGGAERTPYPVSGQVTYRKKPLAEAVVTFHPQPGRPPGHPLSAVTDVEGRFSLTTRNPQDGAPQGEYAVTVVFLEKRKDGDEMLRNGRNLLPPKYADPETSGLKATVQPQANTLEPFALTD